MKLQWLHPSVPIQVVREMRNIRRLGRPVALEDQAVLTTRSSYKLHKVEVSQYEAPSIYLCCPARLNPSFDLGLGTTGS